MRIEDEIQLEQERARILRIILCRMMSMDRDTAISKTLQELRESDDD